MRLILPKFILTASLLLVFQCVIFSQIYYTSFSEGFEHDGLMPLGWTQEYVKGSQPWRYEGGGYSTDNSVPLSRTPTGSHTGQYNALFQLQSVNKEATKLVSPEITGLKDFGINPVLKFWHSMGTWVGTDELNVYFKAGKDSAWVLLANYTAPIQNADTAYWIERDIPLPVNRLSNSYYIAFEGVTHWGFGVCVDDIKIEETGTLTKKLKSIQFNQPELSPLPAGTYANQIMRIDVKTIGNTGSLKLKKFTVKPDNTDNTDIDSVKLFFTSDSIFSPTTKIGATLNFNSGNAVFDNLSFELPFGMSFLWVTYSIKKTALPGHYVDAIIPQGGININDSILPASDIAPPGNRVIFETVFFDDFETDKGWSLTGEFQRAIPTGLGGSIGNPDPTIAYSGVKVLGTDLTGLGANHGDYEPDLPANGYLATSPLFDLSYYKNIQIGFYKWINVDYKDNISFQVSNDSGVTWHNIWWNSTIMMESKWSQLLLNLPVSFERKSGVMARFTLGPTDNFWNFSGWNIDDFTITGEHIVNDVGVTVWLGPGESCGMADTSTITVRVKNFADGPTLNPIPIEVSFNNGITYMRDTIFQSIPKNGSINFKFRQKVNLSNPNVYKIIAKTIMTGDQDPSNDSISLSLYSYGVRPLPYANDFESPVVVWKPSGNRLLWQLGTPIDLTPPSGSKAWVTGLSGDYDSGDSVLVESPCFDFTNIEKPIVEFKFWNQSEKNHDGTVLQYSINSGMTWQDVPRHSYSQWDWNWYTNNNIAALHGQGWDTTLNSSSSPWLIARQFLPNDIVNQTGVKFRFKFQSEINSLRYRGFAFDDFKLYNAPYDNGVTSIDNLNTSYCQDANPQKLKITVKNFGVRNDRQNDTIVVGVKVNGVVQAVDTFKLASDILIDGSQQFTMTKPIKIHPAGNYKINAFIIEKYPFYYSTNNDTSVASNVTIKPNPITNLPDTAYSALPDTFIIRALKQASYDYNWEFGGIEVSDSSSVAVKIGGQIRTGKNKNFLLTVTDTRGNGCQTIDSINFKTLIADVGAIKILNLNDSCGYGTTYHPQIQIKNFGTDTIKQGEIIPIRSRLDKNFINGKADTINYILPVKLAPKQILNISLKIPLDGSHNPVNLSSPGAYTFRVRTFLSTDTAALNDSTSTSFTISGYPVFDLGPDIYLKAVKFTIKAPQGLKTYNWNGISGPDSMVITNSGKYNLSVTDNNNCPAKDSVNIRLAIHDLSFKRITGPFSACAFTDSSIVSCVVVNSGTDTIKTSENLLMNYKVDNNVTLSENIYLLKNLLPGDSATYAFSKKIWLVNTGSHKLFINAALQGDFDLNNDTVTSIVSTYGYPHISLGVNRNDHMIRDTLRTNADRPIASYLWQMSGLSAQADSIFVITKDNFATDNIYNVTVSDIHNCQANAAVHVFLIDEDLAVSQITSLPYNKICTLSNSEAVEIKVSNIGNQIINKSFNLSYSINDSLPVIQNFDFVGNPGDFASFIFDKKANLSKKGIYKIKISLQLSGDVWSQDDTLTHVINVTGSPKINFAGSVNDTIMIDRYPFTLDPGNNDGINTFEWSTGESTPTINALSDGKYIVTITDQSSCPGIASVMVLKKVPDLGITKILLPSVVCKLPKDTTIEIEIVNSGNMPFVNLPVIIQYKIDENAFISQNVHFNGNPHDTVIYSFDQKLDLSTAGSYIITGSLVYAGDSVAENNSLAQPLKISDNPVVTFIGISTDTIKISIFPKVLDPGPGYKTYIWGTGDVTEQYIATRGGFYSVTVTDNNSCIGSKSIFLSDVTSIKNIDENADLFIYPNPVHDKLFLNIKLKVNPFEEVNIELISSEGKSIIRKKIKGDGQFLETIDVNSLSKGFYYIKIYQSDWVSINKILVQ